LETGLALDSIGFRWTGCDEDDQVEGEGTAELLEGGSIEIVFAAENSSTRFGLGRVDIRLGARTALLL
jgi:hypothetical protein